MRTYFFKTNTPITIVGANEKWYVELSRGEGLISRVICKSIFSQKITLNFIKYGNQILTFDFNTKLVTLSSIKEDIKEIPIMVSEEPVDEKIVHCNSVTIETIQKGTYAIFERIVFGESPEETIDIPEQYVDFLKKIEERSSGDDKDFTISQSELDLLAEIYEKTRK